MIKILPILLVIISVITNYKYWDETNNISWNDFKKVKSLQGSEAAKIHVATSSSFDYENGILNIEIRTYMDPKNSFVIKNEETELLLSHEQLHFDIQELYSRKIRKRMQNAELTFNTLSKDLNTIFKEEMNACYKLQALYDKETEHSLNETKQKEWETKISDYLKEYDDYKNFKLMIKFE